MLWLNVLHLKQHEEADRAYLFDPAMDAAPIDVSVGDLMLAWSHFDYTYAVLNVFK
jgi:hypothetical protein